MRIEPQLGRDIRQVVGFALGTACLADEPVQFDFNGTEVEVRPTDSFDRALLRAARAVGVPIPRSRNPKPVTGKVNFKLYQIDDVPGYGWELNYTDPTGEDWSFDQVDLEDALEHIRDCCNEWDIPHIGPETPS